MDNANSYVHHVLRSIVREGEVVVDATVGNGHDTVFLADLIGKNGLVIGFDVLDTAIRATQMRLRECKATVLLICDGHQNIDQHIDVEHSGSIAAVTFNLGYLPGGDKSATTGVETTLIAVRKSLQLLRAGGVLSIVCYRHPEGEMELYAIRDLLKGLPQSDWTSIETNFVNQRGNPPVVFVVSKRTIIKDLQ